MTRTDADEQALDIMTARKRAEPSEEDLRPTKYLRWEYGIDSCDHVTPNNLRPAVVEVVHNDD